VDIREIQDLIFKAEDSQFSKEQSRVLSEKLLLFAIKFRNSYDVQHKEMIHSAVRTGLSMLDHDSFEGCSHLLLSLLQPGYAVETFPVAVKMIGRIFEAQPPVEIDHYLLVSLNVSGIAKLFTNCYSVTISQNAANAYLSTKALAAMASSKVYDVMQDVARMRVDWYERRVRRGLCELRDAWNEKSTGVSPDVLKFIEGCLVTLEQHKVWYENLNKGRETVI